MFGVKVEKKLKIENSMKVCEWISYGLGKIWKTVHALHASVSKVQNFRNLGIFNWNNDFKISNLVVFVSLLK